MKAPVPSRPKPSVAPCKFPVKGGVVRPSVAPYFPAVIAPDSDDEVEVRKATLAALRPENVARPLMSRGFPATGDGNPDLATKESTSRLQ